MKRINLRDFEIGGDKLTILAGPCAIESMEILDETAQGLKEITEKLGINFVFKSFNLAFQLVNHCIKFIHQFSSNTEYSITGDGTFIFIPLGTISISNSLPLRLSSVALCPDIL